MRYLVTGGAGFIGSNITRRIIANGDQAVVLDDFSTGRQENLSGIEDQIKLIKGDIRDYKAVEAAVEGIDYVLHLAAVPSVPQSIANPRMTNEVNIGGTLNVLEASRQAGVKKLVFASSCAIYGDDPRLPKTEDMAAAPMSPYAIHKLTGEYYCKLYWELYHFPTVALRFFNIFGPHQDPASDYAAVIPKFITKLLAGKEPIVFGDGEQTRDFIFIDNCVSANLLAATNEKMVGDCFHVASGRKYSLNQLLDSLQRIIGTDLKPEYAEAKEGDIKHSYASIEKSLAAGYKVGVSFEEGLKRTVEYFKK